MYCINKSYIMRNVDGKIFLINMKEGEAHLLNQVATIILEYIVECGDLDKSLRKTEEYFSDVDPIRIEDDYRKLVKEFIQKRILVDKDYN